MSRIAITRCLLAAVLFGAAAPAASRLAGSVPAFNLAGLLYIGAALAVGPAVFRTRPSRRAIAIEWRAVAAAVVFGGAIGPLLLVLGLARTNAASASILLNTELVATVVFAGLLFHEHLGGRLLVSAGLVTIAGAVLVWEPGAAVDLGALLIVAACACWGIDNCVTARIEHLAPEHVVALKGIVAGGANLAIGLTVSGWGGSTDVSDVVAALAIGAAGYGWSITLWVKGARDLGAARGQLIFATAPFIGAVLAWVLLRDDVTAVQLIAVGLAAFGIGISLRTDHEHAHRHDVVEHDHEHLHGDGHHEHVHADGFTGRHVHAHWHDELVHAHPHAPDLHHRHDH